MNKDNKMTNTEIFNRLKKVSKLSVLPLEVTAELVQERKAIHKEYISDIPLMKTKTQEVNDKYLAMEVELIEASMDIDGKVVTASDSARQYLNDTDWYEIRLMSRGVVIPEEVIALRDEAIAFLNRGDV